MGKNILKNTQKNQPCLSPQPPPHSPLKWEILSHMKVQKASLSPELGNSRVRKPCKQTLLLLHQVVTPSTSPFVVKFSQEVGSSSKMINSLLWSLGILVL